MFDDISKADQNRAPSLRKRRLEYIEDYIIMDIAFLFAIEGFLLQFTGSINTFGNNLYATNLGATDTQIGLIQTVPNLFVLLLLLPLGMLSDRIRNIKRIPILTLAAMTFGYLVMSVVPMAGSLRILLFFFALIFTIGGSVLYNAQWQNFFGEVVPLHTRNDIITRRSRFMFGISIIAPIICGGFLNNCHGITSKLTVFRVFFFICAICTAIQMFVLSRIQTPERTEKKESIHLSDVTRMIHLMVHSKDFMLFFIPIILFYMFWQMDWSMWYIGQTQYLLLNESQLSIFNGIFNIGQLIAIGILSRIVWKKGNDYTICYAGIGLLLCPLIIIFCANLPVPMRMPVFTVLLTVCNAGQCATNLCIVQILLRVSPKECRSLAISFYTFTITLTNSFMPYTGVRIYEAFGSGYNGFVKFFLITAFIRALTLAALVGRYLYLKRHHALDIERPE